MRNFMFFLNTIYTFLEIRKKVIFTKNSELFFSKPINLEREYFALDTFAVT